MRRIRASRAKPRTFGERLRALGSRRLVAAKYFKGEDCCVLGACLPELRDQLVTFEYNEDAVKSVAIAVPAVAEALAAVGLTIAEATVLQKLNDCYSGPPAQRYEMMLRVVTLVEEGKLVLTDVGEKYDGRWHDFYTSAEMQT